MRSRCWLQPLHQRRVELSQGDSILAAAGGMTPRVCFPFLPPVNGVCCLLDAQARQLILQNGLTLSDLDRHPEVSGTAEGETSLDLPLTWSFIKHLAPLSSPEDESLGSHAAEHERELA